MAVVGGTLEMNHPAEKKNIKKKNTEQTWAEEGDLRNTAFKMNRKQEASIS